MTDTADITTRQQAIYDYWSIALRDYMEAQDKGRIRSCIREEISALTSILEASVLKEAE